MTLDELRRLHDQARAARRRFEASWSMNVAFAEGEQWVAFAGSRLFKPKLDPDRITLTYNRILPAIRKEVAKLTKQRPTFKARPRTAGDDDMAAAELAEQILEYHWNHLRLPTHFPRALLWSRACVAGFLKVTWDSTLGDGTDVLVGPDGQPVVGADQRPITIPMDPEQLAAQMGLPSGSIQRRTVNQGDIRVAVRSPFQIFPDPLAETFDEIEWLVEESIVSADYVRDRYKVAVEPDTPANPGVVQTQLMPFGSQSGAYKGVKLMELWRKPCGRYPNGYTATWTGKQLLEENDRPFDPMPYVMFRGIDLPGRFWGTCISEQMRDAQTEKNKTHSQLAENRNRIGNPTLIADRTAIGDPDEFERQASQPGGVLYVDPTSQDPFPRYLSAPEMPAYVEQLLDRQEQELQEISGQHDVSNAQVPPGVTAASAINLLQEQDDTMLGPSIIDMAAALSDLGSKILRLTARFYDDQRTIALATDNDGWKIFDFRGAMLKDHTHVECQVGSLIPQSTAAKQAFIQSIITLFLQNGQAVPAKNLARAFRDMQIGGAEHLVDEYSRNEEQIQRENSLLAQGQLLPINNYDDDDAHIDGHQDFQRQPRYQRMPDPVKAVFEQHVAAHRQRQADQQAAEQQVQMMPQLAQAGQQLQLNAAQGAQQMQQAADQHDQQMVHNDQMHQQRLAQMRAQAAQQSRR